MDVVIIGAGTTAQLAVSILADDRNLRVVGCVDVAWPDEQKMVLDIPIIGDHSVLKELLGKGIRSALVAVAENRIREQHFYAAQTIGFEMVNAVHASAIIGKSVRLGIGVCIGEGSVVSTGSIIGDNVVVEAGATIGSHVDIGSNVYIGNGTVIGNAAVIGRNCFLDVSVSVARKVNVGKNHVFEPGVNVNEDVADIAVAGE